MRLLGRLRRLRAPERRALLRAGALLLGLALAIRILPFARVEALVRRLAGGRSAVGMPTDRLAWAVAAAGRRLPGATCLVQALALRVLVGRQGTPATVRVGVAREPGRLLESHAWVESEGRVLIGHEHLERYVAITTVAAP